MDIPVLKSLTTLCHEELKANRVPALKHFNMPTELLEIPLELFENCLPVGSSTPKRDDNDDNIDWQYIDQLAESTCRRKIMFDSTETLGSTDSTSFSYVDQDTDLSFITFETTTAFTETLGSIDSTSYSYEDTDLSDLSFITVDSIAPLSFTSQNSNPFMSCQSVDIEMSMEIDETK